MSVLAETPRLTIVRSFPQGRLLDSPHPPRDFTEVYGRTTRDVIERARGGLPKGVEEGDKRVYTDEAALNADLSTTKLEEVVVAPGGGGANVSTGLAEFGARVRFLTALPYGEPQTDTATDQILGFFDQHGVQVDRLRYPGQHSTSHILLPDKPGADRAVLYTAPKAPTHKPPAERPGRINIYANSMAGDDAAEALQGVTTRAEEARIGLPQNRRGLYVVTFGSDQFRRALAGEENTVEAMTRAGRSADAVMLNRGEWAKWLKLHGQKPLEDELEFAYQLVDTGIQGGVITHDRGINVVTADGFFGAMPRYDAEPPSSDDGSTLGTGDGVAAAMSASLIKGHDLLDSAAVGAVAGRDIAQAPDANSGRQSYDSTYERSRVLRPRRIHQRPLWF